MAVRLKGTWKVYQVLHRYDRCYKAQNKGHGINGTQYIGSTAKALRNKSAEDQALSRYAPRAIKKLLLTEEDK